MLIAWSLPNLTGQPVSTNVAKHLRCRLTAETHAARSFELSSELFLVLVATSG